jgi:hypothetical protein
MLNAAAGRRGKITEDPIDANSKTRIYNEIYTALELALLVEPDSDTISSQIAIVEEYFRNFESAYKRLTKVINSMRARVDGGSSEALISRITQKGRVAIRLSTQLRQSSDPILLRRARDLLRECAHELREQEGNALYLANRASESTGSKGVDRARLNEIVYYCLWITMETSLELGEMELEGGDPAQARSEFEYSKKVLEKVEYFARERNISLPPRIADLRKRITEGLVAVRTEASASERR